MHLSRFILALLLVVAALPALAAETIGPWVPIFKGVDHARAETDTPRLMKIQALRVDLLDPDVSFLSTPSNGAASLETFGQTTGGFLTEHGLQAAINANFFSPCCSSTVNEPKDVLGIAISRGDLVSPPVGTGLGSRALVITTNNAASIVTTTLPYNTAGIYTAVGGSPLLVQNGVNVGANDQVHPRTAVGVSQNGRYLYMITIDGRQTGFSEGAADFDTANWLIRFGAHNGANLDGGGSTTMVKANGSGGVAVLNSPSDGQQRVVGNNFGVFAPPVAPGILTQPQGQSVVAGQNAAFSVFAGGTTPLAYQWRLNGAPLPGATSTNLVVTNAQSANGGSYTVVITNVAGAITSAPAVLNVQFSLAVVEGFGGTVSRNPSQANHNAGSTVTLTAAPDPGFEFAGWSGDATGTNNPLNLVMSSNTVVTANFTGWPEDIILDNPDAEFTGVWTLVPIGEGMFGSTYHRTTTVTGAANRTATYRPDIRTPGLYAVYLWHLVDSTVSTNAPWEIAHSGGSETVHVDQSQDGGAWRLIATGRSFARGTNGFIRLNNNSGDTSRRVVADGVRLVFGVPPVITNQPQDQFVLAGGTAVFSGGAEGPGPLFYQWRHNGAPIAGATGTSFTRTNVQLAHEGLYSVAVSNYYGTTLSAAAGLEVHAPPAITQHPQSQSAAQAVDVTFTAAATGSPPLGFQWRFNGADIPGATAASHTRTNTQPADAGHYSVLVTNFVSSALSSNALLTVGTNPAPPSITMQPQGRAVIAGSNVTFSVTANGTLPLHYRWLFNGAAIGGETAPTLALPNVQPASAGNYSVIVSNDVGAVTSSIAPLTVNYSLTATGAVGGTVGASPNQGVFAPNAGVTLTAIPDPGFTFNGWSGDAGGTNNPMVFSMTTNKAIVANFIGDAPELILDNSDPRVSYTGDWQTGTSAAGRYGSDYRFASTVVSATTSNAFYRPVIVTPGKYDVYIWFPQGSNRSTNAQWHVSHEGGSMTVGFNQSINGGAWRLIAAGAEFAKGTNGFVRLSNDTGENNKVVMADAVRFAFNNPPVITAHPASLAVPAGGNASFSVTASGSGPFSYQWFHDGAPLAGADASTLSLTNIQPADAGVYQAHVSNPSGATPSTGALLSVTPPGAPQFLLVERQPDGRIRFEAVTDPGVSHALQASTNLTDWVTLTNLSSQSGVIEFLDPDSTNHTWRFYRLSWPP